jgi:hypothetical protein
VVKDGRPMALELAGGGDTEEDDEGGHVVKRALRKGKGKQRDLGQQSDHEHCLQIIVVYQLTRLAASSLQPRHDHDDESPLDANPDTLDDFNVNENAKSMDDWFGDQQTVELTQKNPSKFSVAVAIEVSSFATSYRQMLRQLLSQRPTWNSTGPSLGPSVAGRSSMPGLPSTPGLSSTPGFSLMPGLSSTLGLSLMPGRPSMPGLSSMPGGTGPALTQGNVGLNKNAKC